MVAECTVAAAPHSSASSKTKSYTYTRTEILCIRDFCKESMDGDYSKSGVLGD